MAFTGHGHHIPGTVLPPRNDRPKNVARCGGVRFCPRCKDEFEAYKRDHKYQGSSAPQVPEDRAKYEVRKYVNDLHLGNARFEVKLVTFAYILGGWKAHVITDLEDELYFEVTYNSSEDVIYLDTYQKISNIVIEG
jgi:Family of unknown function (DUF6275)